jgi:uncharacterized membrane protein YdcZ (DUF606 family)
MAPLPSPLLRAMTDAPSSSSSGGGSLSTGLTAVAACILLFGVFPLPTKAYRTGDGVLFQFFMCCGIFVVGIVTHFVQCRTGRNEGFPLDVVQPSCPQFEPMSAIGGAIWCTSNMLLVPLVKCIGVGLCMMVWGMAEMIAGWATGRFGLFGLAAEPVTSDVLNSAGVALALLSLVILAAVQPALSDGGGGETTTRVPADKVALLEVETEMDAAGAAAAGGDRSAPLLPPAPPSEQAVVNDPAAAAAAAAAHFDEHGYDVTVYLTARQKRVGGILFSLVAGLLSGSTFTAPEYVVDSVLRYSGPLAGSPFPGASTTLLDHVYSHFTGIFLASAVYFFLYCVVSRNRPWISAPLLLPSFISGVTWGLAMVSWFVANENLSIVISFPMVTLGPGLVNVLIGCVVFKEIEGSRNYLLLGSATLIFLGASILISLSGGAS